MPGPDDAPLILPALCGTYARKPRRGETVELTMCSRCTEIRASQRAHQHRSAS